MASAIFRFLLDIFDEEALEEQRRMERERFTQLKLEKKHLRDQSDPFSLPPHFFRKYYR